jgi:hypothetical protein
MKYALSHIVNYQQVSIAFASHQHEGGFTRELRTQQTAKL